jgi:hypothetical protein
MARTSARSVLEGNYTIWIGSTWSLTDFYELPHVFEQAYAFNCAFLLAEEARDPVRLDDVFSLFPWRGGYSAVNFYRSLGSQVPRGLRPKVKSIQYASPGWIELTLAVKAAVAIGTVIGIFVKSAGGLNGLYNEIYKGMTKRKLMRINAKHKELELTRDQIKFVIESAGQLAKAIGFENLEELNQHTGNPLASLKILLSYYRRIRKLAEYVVDGKAEFPTDTKSRTLRKRR